MNKALVCTISGMLGVGTTTALAINATIKTVKKIDETEKNLNRKLTKKEILKLSIKPSIPACVSFIGTIGAIAGANRIHLKTQASLTASLLATKTAYDKYKYKVKELIGPEQYAKLENLLKVEHVQETKEMIPVKPNDVVDRDLYYIGYGYNDYFYATDEEVGYAEAMLNLKLHREGKACINDFFDYLPAAEPTSEGGLYGWGETELCEKMDNGWIRAEDEIVDTGDGLLCRIIEFDTLPVADWDNEPPFEYGPCHYMDYDGGYPAQDETRSLRISKLAEEAAQKKLIV